MTIFQNLIALYKTLQKTDKEIKLPQSILTFDLLRRAKLEKTEEMLVYTGLDFSNKGNLYDQAKKALIKFKGNQMETNPPEAVAVKLESVHQMEGEAFYTYGTGQTGRYHRYKGSGRNFQPQRSAHSFSDMNYPQHLHGSRSPSSMFYGSRPGKQSSLSTRQGRAWKLLALMVDHNKLCKLWVLSAFSSRLPRFI
jgi:hypothetical protein